MKNPAISFNEFEKHLNALKNLDKFESSILSAVSKYNRNCEDYAELILPNLSCNIIELLTILVDDKDGWIDYWAFELKFGEKYEDGSVRNKDGNIIKLETIQDLWNIIILED